MAAEASSSSSSSSAAAAAAAAAATPPLHELEPEPEEEPSDIHDDHDDVIVGLSLGLGGDGGTAAVCGGTKGALCTHADACGSKRLVPHVGISIPP